MRLDLAIIADQEQMAYGLAQLIKIDARFAELADQSGPLPMRKSVPGFEGLAHIVVGQMVSRASADAIWQRMVAELATCTPERYLLVDDEAARRFGLSGAKHRTLFNLSQLLVSGDIDLQTFATMSGDKARKRLTALKGIGPWTADVYLLFALGHPDVFPSGDIALQAAAAHAFALERRPSDKELGHMAHGWRPWRSIAARVLWAYYSNVLKRAVTPLP